MATFTVNGQTVTVEKNQKLIRYLRDQLHLTSVKDGCSEGACGTCHVLIDGKPTKACIPQTDKLEGKTIVTVEGLTDWEKQVYTFAFGEAGAVQCGFCIPGMVISAKGLLDVNPDPTREEAAFAIRNNICRCTGYVKIIDGILLAAKIFREGKLPAPFADDWQMGSRVHRLDVEEKVLGYGQYPDDIYVDGMCYGGAVRSQYARARVLSIDTSEAEALPGHPEGHSRQGERGASEEGSAHPHRRGRDHPLSGRQRGTDLRRGSGDGGGRQKAGEGGVRGAPRHPQPRRGRGARRAAGVRGRREQRAGV